MSVWTHVTGAIRLDDVSFINDERNTIEQVKEVIGPMCLFEDWNEKSSLPRGSEGSIEYEVYQSGDESDIARFNVCLWGDLRDFDSEDAEGIKEWFIDLVREFSRRQTGMYTRDAVLKVSTEGSKSFVICLEELDSESEEVEYNCKIVDL